MPETNTELAERIEKRLENLENDTKKHNRTMNIINGAIAVLVLGLTIGGGFTLTKFFFVLEKVTALDTMAVSKDRVVALETTLPTVARKEDVTKLESEVNHQAQAIARLEKSIGKLEDRLHGWGGSIFHHKEGELNRLEEKVQKFTYLVVKSGEKEWTCKLTPKTRILINGKEAKIEELKPGMKIEASLDDENVALNIEATSQAGKRFLWPGAFPQAQPPPPLKNP